MPSIDNSLYLEFYNHTSETEKADVRANAIFVYSKLIQGGMSIEDAKNAVELLYSNAFDQGYRDASSEARAHYSEN